MEQKTGSAGRHDALNAALVAPELRMLCATGDGAVMRKRDALSLLQEAVGFLQANPSPDKFHAQDDVCLRPHTAQPTRFTFSDSHISATAEVVTEQRRLTTSTRPAITSAALLGAQLEAVGRHSLEGSSPTWVLGTPPACALPPTAVGQMETARSTAATPSFDLEH